MKNTKSLNELIVLAAAVFQDKKNKGVNEVFASEDGFIFIEENRARIHCKSVQDLKYHSISRSQALQAAEDQEMSVIDTKDPNPVENEDPVKTEKDKELEQLKTQYEELFGKAAHHNIGIEKLKTLIAEKLAESEGQKSEGQEPAGEENKNQQPE